MVSYKLSCLQRKQPCMCSNKGSIRLENIAQYMAATRCKTTLSSSSAEDNMALHCRFVCEGTVEERIIKLQEQKLQLAQNVLSG